LYLCYHALALSLMPRANNSHRFSGRGGGELACNRFRVAHWAGVANLRHVCQRRQSWSNFNDTWKMKIINNYAVYHRRWLHGGSETAAIEKIESGLMNSFNLFCVICAPLPASLYPLTTYLNYFEGQKLKLKSSKFGPHWHLQNLAPILYIIYR